MLNRFVEPADSGFELSDHQLGIGSSFDSLLHLFGHPQIFLLKHLPFDEVGRALPMLSLLVGGWFVFDENRVNPAEPIGGGWVDAESREVVGVSNEDRIGKDQKVRGYVGSQRTIQIGWRCLGDRFSRGHRPDVVPVATNLAPGIEEERIDRISMESAEVIALKKEVDDEFPIRLSLTFGGHKDVVRSEAECIEVRVERAEMGADPIAG